MNEAEWTRAVVERPDDTELRLVFADWLEERGELGRATFIRQQCALAGLPKWARGWAEHWQGRHRDAAVRPELPEGVRWPSFAFERGFASRLDVVDAEVFLAHAEEIFARAPITAITFDARYPPFPLQRLLDRPELRRIRALKFKLGGFDAEAIARIDACPHLVSLEKLAFTYGGIDAHGVRALLRSSIAARVSKLGLRNNFFVEHGAPLVDAFREAPSLPRLRSLNLESNRIGAAGMVEILRPLVGLRELLVHDNPLGDEGAALIAEATTGFQALDLSKIGLQLPGLRALVTSEHLQTLSSLRLRTNRLGPRAAKVLASTNAWSALEFLDLGDNDLGDAGLESLLDSALFARLPRADVLPRGTRSTAPGIRERALKWYYGRSRAGD